MGMSADKVDAVVLAGAPALTARLRRAPAEAGADAPPRAMIAIGGKTMLQWVVDALRRSHTIGRVRAVGDVRADGLDEVIAATGDFLGNVLAGVESTAASGAKSVLLVTSDIPLVTEDGIDDFVTRASAVGADFCYPIIPKSDCIEKYPGIRRTYLKLREGTFAGGNLIFASVGFLMENRDLIARAHESRKSIFRLAGMIGWGVLARVIAAQFIYRAAVDIPALERAASKLLKGNVRAVITSYAEIGEDVDKPDDLAAVERLLAAG